MRMGRPNVMRYKQLKNAQKKAQKEVTADGRGIDFLNEWYVRKDMSRAVHLIFPDVEDAYEPVPLHKTKDNIEFPCTEREDCVGCEDNLELKEKRGLTVIACEWYHDIESQGYGGKMVTKSEQCPGERACDHCRAGIPRYFGKKQVAILPPTQFVSALDAYLDTQRKCAACKNDLIPTMLTCPQCGDTLLEVGNGVTFDMIEESFNGQVSCPTHGFVNPDTFDICRDATKQEVECSVSAPGDPDHLILSLKKTTGQFPVLISTGFSHENFWDRNPDLKYGHLPRREFVPDWDQDMQLRFLKMRRKQWNR